MSGSYYFLHIPKTAGTSIYKLLDESGRFNVCPYSSWGDMLRHSDDDLSKYDMFRGHFYRYIHKYVDIPLNTFTFLRNPFARSLSQYEHYLRDKGHFFHKRAVAQGSFLNFLRDPVTQALIKNFQVRSLSSIFDPKAVWESMTPAQRKNNELEYLLYCMDPGLSDDTALLMAKEYVSRCICVCITEKMEQSLAVLGDALGLASPPPVERLNANPKPSLMDSWTSQEWSVLSDLLALDWELYEFGHKLLLERFAKIAHRHDEDLSALPPCPAPGNGHLDFHRGAQGTLCLMDGWGAPDQWGVRARGLCQHLTLPVRGQDRMSILLRVHLKVAMRPGEPRREMTVSVNGIGVGSWVFLPEETEGECEVLIPPDVLPAGIAPVVEIQTAASDSLRQDNDASPFGMSFAQMAFV